MAGYIPGGSSGVAEGGTNPSGPAPGYGGAGYYGAATDTNPEGMFYGASSPGDVGGGGNAWDTVSYDKWGNPNTRDGLSDEERLRRKAMGDLYRSDAWAKGVEGRDALSMQAAQLDPFSRMNWANAGSGAMGKASTIDQTQGNESRAYQMALMGQLQTQANGGGPSLAGAQLKSGMEQNLAAQMAASASQRGTSNTAMGQRNYAMMGAQQGQNLASQSAMARMQEQLNAQQQLGSLSSNVRGQDYGFANAQAGYDQQMALANQSSANQFSLANAGFLQQKYAADAAAANQYGLQQGMFNQQANQGNLQSGLAQRASGDEARRWAYGQTQGAWDTARGIAQHQRDADQAQANADRENTNQWIKLGAGAFGTAMAGPVGGAIAAKAADEGTKK